jgi:hypothetical protein
MSLDSSLSLRAGISTTIQLTYPINREHGSVTSKIINGEIPGKCQISRFCIGKAYK